MILVPDSSLKSFLFVFYKTRTQHGILSSGYPYWPTSKITDPLHPNRTSVPRFSRGRDSKVRSLYSRLYTLMSQEKFTHGWTQLHPETQHLIFGGFGHHSPVITPDTTWTVPKTPPTFKCKTSQGIVYPSSDRTPCCQVVRDLTYTGVWPEVEITLPPF